MRRTFAPRLALISFAAATLLPARISAAPLPSTPEQTVRQLTGALLRGDRTAVQSLTQGDGQAAAALTELEPAPEQAQRLEADPSELTIEQLRPHEVAGRRVRNDDPRNLPAGATALLAATLQGGQTQIWRLVRSPTGWQADLRWAGRARAMAEWGPALEPVGSPEWVARRLTLALLRLDREQARELMLPGSDLAMPFLGAPDQPEPSGHLLALAMEMPLVRLEPQEAAPLPDGRVIVAGDEPDRQLLLGLFGVSEVPFLLQRIDGNWRVVPQPWLPLLLR
jgi:hypothetical protein